VSGLCFKTRLGSGAGGLALDLGLSAAPGKTLGLSAHAMLGTTQFGMKKAVTMNPQHECSCLPTRLADPQL
jgi:hypothetical protein